MTKEEIEVLLKKVIEFTSMNEPSGTDDEIDAFYQLVANEFQSIVSLLKREDLATETHEKATKMRRIMSDIRGWMTIVNQRLDKTIPDRSRLISIIRQGLDEGRREELRQLKNWLIEKVSETLSKEGM